MAVYWRGLIFFLVTLVVFSHASRGQSRPDSLKMQKNAVSLNILQIISGEVVVGYERLLWNRFSARAYGGYKYPYSNGPYQANGSSIITMDKTFLYTKGYRLGADIIYYLSSSYGLYISGGFYYSHGNYDHLIYEYCTGQSKENYVHDQSYKEDIYGISTLIGTKIPLTRRNSRWQLDIFGGLSIVHIIEKTTVYRKKQGTCNCDADKEWLIYDPPQKSNNDHWQPSIRVGLACSFSF